MIFVCITSCLLGANLCSLKNLRNIRHFLCTDLSLNTMLPFSLQATKQVLRKILTERTVSSWKQATKGSSIYDVLYIFELCTLLWACSPPSPCSQLLAASPSCWTTPSRQTDRCGSAVPRACRVTKHVLRTTNRCKMEQYEKRLHQLIIELA